jgi:hypothetical protein
MRNGFGRLEELTAILIIPLKTAAYLRPFFISSKEKLRSSYLHH